VSPFRDATHTAADGAQLAYRIRPGRDPWVLLHALACDATLWDGVVASLPEDVGLVLPELRGHGGSTFGWALPSVDLFAADVLGILDAEGIGAAGIAGLSMGGYVALAIAAARPAIARAWVLLSTQARAEDADGKAARAEALGIVDRQGWAIWLDRVMPCWVSLPEQHVAHLRGMAGRAGEAGLAVAMLALANRPDRRELLQELRQPLTAVAGEDDPITPRERVQEIADGVPGGKLVVVPKASHLVPLDAPAAVASLLV
jgi:pimeloyl-ACP methyl ester carboxylesterase